MLGAGGQSNQSLGGWEDFVFFLLCRVRNTFCIILGVLGLSFFESFGWGFYHTWEEGGFVISPRCDGKIFLFWVRVRMGGTGEIQVVMER